MKKPQHNILAIITVVFAAFVIGFFFGRNANHTDVQVSVRTASVSPAETRNSPDRSAEDDKAMADGRLNINTATLEQLDTLPGIGTELAQRIIDYREENGPFTTVAQLTMVEGIGDSRLAEIMDLITAQ